MELLRLKNHQQLPRSSKPNIAIICKKHPKHQQSPGVCSICLCEKLSQLSKASRSKNTRKLSASINAAAAAEEEEEEDDSSCSSSSLSDYSPSQCSSCACSDCSSPLYGRMASDVRGSYSVFSRGAAGRNYYHDQLMKSRSMAAAVTTSERIRERISSEGTDRHTMKKKKKEKSHFWSKLLLLRPRGKRFEEAAATGGGAGLVHSRTMREMLTTAAH